MVPYVGNGAQFFSHDTGVCDVNLTIITRWITASKAHHGASAETTKSAYHRLKQNPNTLNLYGILPLLHKNQKPTEGRGIFPKHGPSGCTEARAVSSSKDGVMVIGN